MTCPEVKLTGPSMEQRVANRQRPSGDTKHADHTMEHGTGPTRLRMEVHHSRNQQYSDGVRGVDINGNKRGVV
jgi:hypothetical protein